MWNININKEKGETTSDYLFPLIDWESNYNLFIAAMISFGNHDDINYFIAGKYIDQNDINCEDIKYCRINMLKAEYIDYEDSSPLSGLILSAEDIEYMSNLLSKKYKYRPDCCESNITFWQKLIEYNNTSHYNDHIYHPNCHYKSLQHDLPIPDYFKLLHKETP